MSLEELLDMSADQLEKMTDKELEDYFRPFFNVTRPEQVARKSSGGQLILSPMQQKQFAEMEKLGIDTSGLRKKLAQQNR